LFFASCRISVVPFCSTTPTIACKKIQKITSFIFRENIKPRNNVIGKIFSKENFDAMTKAKGWLGSTCSVMEKCLERKLGYF
jgi:hypothetical protein